jgi:hypothetical protein
VVADTDAPSIEVLGDDVVEIDCGTAWTDPGATAIDACEGEVTVISDADSVVDTSTPGTYEISYLAEDSQGLQAIAARTVIVGGPACGGGGVCTLSSFAVNQPANDSILIPEGAALERVLFSATVIDGGESSCADATTRVTYTVDGAIQVSDNRAAGFPVVYFLGAGSHSVRAVADVVDGGSSLTQEFQLTVAAAPDADGNGLLDQPFANLVSDGDSWSAGTQSGGSDGTTAMATWFGDCESAGDDIVEVRVRNPEDSAQVLTVRLDRAVLECGEQGILTVAFGEKLRNIFSAEQAQAIPAAPDGVAADGPYFDVSVIVSSDEGQSFAPLAGSRLAAHPVTFSLTGVTIPDADSASFVRFPTTAVPDGNGGFVLEAGSGSWSAATIQNLSVDGSTLTGDSTSLSLFAPLAPSAGKDPNGPACAPGRGSGASFTGDLLLAAALLALLVWRGRAGTATR